MTRITGILRERQYIFTITSLAQFFYNGKHFRPKLQIKSKPTLYFQYFFRKLCRLLDNVEKHGTARQATDDTIIRRMDFACWITKPTDTLEMCNTYRFPIATMVARTCQFFTLYVYCLSCATLQTIQVYIKINRLTPNDHYSGRTAPLTSKVAFYIFIQQIQLLNILNMVYTLLFSLKNAVYFIILTYLVPVLFTFYIQGVLQVKK